VIRHSLRERDPAAALKQAETQFRNLLEAAPDAMIVAGADGRIALVNAQTEKLFGYEREELIGQPVETLVPARFHGVYSGHREAYVSDPHPRPMGADLDLRAVRRDGTEFPVEISLSPLETDEGTLVTAAVRDISDRRRVELERAHLAAIVESSDDAIIGKTLDGTIISWNRGAEELYGYRADEVIGRNVSILLPPDRPEELSGLLELIADGQEVEPFETVRVHRGGRLIDVSVSVSPVVDAAGKVEGAASIARDITERKRVESQLQFLADHDVLTGLFNRRRFIEELTQRVELANRYGRSGAVVMLDVDNFKEINDTLGHRAGDDTVRAVASVLRRRLRSTDVLARLGGDEFAVVLPEADGDQAVAVASDLLETLRRTPLFVSGRRARVTTSAGVAMFEPGGDADAEQMLAFADLAMYEAKEAGRDRLAVYSRAAGREALFESRFSTAQRVRAALENEGLALHIQPIMKLVTEEVSQCEMLLRMESGNGELITAGAFLGAAERSGMITELDRWVVRNAIELAARERDAGRWKSFEINLSGRSIGDDELPRIIAEGVHEHDLDPAALIFEVTETAAIANMEEARGFASSLKRLGCRFALDDFGAGFGSFYYLKYLPLDFLKIDGDFIRDLASSSVDQVLVRGVVEVARGLGMETIAECVEDAETLALLSEYEVDYAQGFHVGRPRPAFEVPQSA
jgi:diguanylate cyclase (GGDEF)-like protein/PAS domain S-box-containing protein